MYLEASQIRAARALLDWTVEDLAKATSLNKDSIKNAERSHTQPRAQTMTLIREAFERAGVIFLDGSGVKLRSDIVRTIEGDDALKRFLDDVYSSVLRSGGEIFIAGLDENKFVEAIGEKYLNNHLDRIAKIGVKERLLIEEGDSNLVANKLSYKWIPKRYFSPTPMYIYANSVAMVYWGPPIKVVVIDNKDFHVLCSGMFNFVWDKANMVSLGE